MAGGTNNASNISATIDYLPLLAEFEIFGKRTYANSYEKNYQAQYAYYANGNSKVKYKHSDATAAAAWWSRSPCYGNHGIWCFASSSGAAGNSSTYYSRALAPAFAV